ncbi:MAG: hypothetical protein ACD_39C01384G0001 [uncultured bacterium]|nr:MAG: hypothetical protein ACD_39C01384G0001 [uncultured bacterium]
MARRFKFLNLKTGATQQALVIVFFVIGVAGNLLSCRGATHQLIPCRVKLVGALFVLFVYPGNFDIILAKRQKTFDLY